MTAAGQPSTAARLHVLPHLILLAAGALAMSGCSKAEPPPLARHRPDPFGPPSPVTAGNTTAVEGISAGNPADDPE